MGHIFISYSHKDKEYVYKLQDALRKEGFDSWIDSRINYGKTWPKEIQKHLDECNAFIVVMTEYAYESEWVQNEVARARRKKKPFFALLLRGDPWLSFEAIQYEDVSGGKLPQKKFYDDLAHVVPFETIGGSHQGNAIRKALARAIPFLKFVGILITIVSILWAGSWAFPKFVELIPTPQATAIVAQREATSTNSPVSPTKTPKPSATPSIPTSTKPPVFTSTAIPLPNEITDAKGVRMNLVKNGQFKMGDDYGEANAKPSHLVILDSFYIDIFEVTNGSYKSCVDLGKCSLPQQKNSYSRSNYYGNSDFDDYPVIYVDWNQAKTYCEWRDANLPTEAQWEKAARGLDNREYPWGGSWVDINCDNANYGGTSGCVGDTNKVGSYEGGRSPYGIYDMSGNVLEWVDDWYDVSYYQNSPRSNPLGPSSGMYHVLRGGSWTNLEFYISLYLSTSYRSFANRFYAYYDLGFRCAKSAP